MFSQPKVNFLLHLLLTNQLLPKLTFDMQVGTHGYEGDAAAFTQVAAEEAHDVNVIFRGKSIKIRDKPQ